MKELILKRTAETWGGMFRGKQLKTFLLGLFMIMLSVAVNRLSDFKIFAYNGEPIMLSGLLGGLGVIVLGGQFLLTVFAFIYAIVAVFRTGQQVDHLPGGLETAETEPAAQAQAPQTPIPQPEVKP